MDQYVIAQLFLGEQIADSLFSLFRHMQKKIPLFGPGKNSDPPQRIELPLDRMARIWALFDNVRVNLAFAEKTRFLWIETDTVSAP